MKFKNFNNYIYPRYLFNGHLQTIIPSLLRKPKLLQQPKKIRLSTLDNDFLDLDYYQNKKNNELVIISHGLEGNSSKGYVRGMVNQMLRSHFDVIAWNYRGCSSEMNKLPILYHSGSTYDLSFVINSFSDKYEAVFLVGFSLGGNMTLKYMGEENVNKKIKKVLAISSPLDLLESSKNLEKKDNFLYQFKFLRSLKNKIKLKHKQYPDIFPISLLKNIKTVYEFDDKYTAPIHGFKNALDYYEKCSSVNFLPFIKKPTLILNTKNDPFLTKESLQIDGVNNPNIQFHLLDKGGHCGFPTHNSKINWIEIEASKYFRQA